MKLSDYRYRRIKQMKAVAVCLAISLAAGGSAFAAERAPKHPKIEHAPKQEASAKCVTPLGDFLHSIGDESKDLSTSKPLTDKQYAFISEETRKHAPLKKIAGDGAIMIYTDGAFAVIFTKGMDDSAMVCAIMAVPVEIVAGIISIDESTKTPNSGTDHAAPKEEPWL
jgi:hypothetical protein